VYNALVKPLYEAINNLPLAVWVDARIAGDLLDIIGEGIYGRSRPVVQTGTPYIKGVYNTDLLNEQGFSEFKDAATYKPVTITDVLYKRYLTWHLYRGDGNQFSLPWLKRRIARFVSPFNTFNPLDRLYVEQISLTILGYNGDQLKLSEKFLQGAGVLNGEAMQVLPILNSLGFLNLPINVQLDFNV
jgi:hypothetical protein